MSTAFIHQLIQGLSRRRNSLWRMAYLIVITFFLAKAVNLLMAFKFMPFEISSVSSSLRSPSTSDGPPVVSIQRILSRNIFDSQASTRLSLPERPVHDGQLNPSTLAAELLGTIVYRNSKFSVALVKDRGANRAEYYGIGEKFLGATLVRIERFRIIVDNNGRLEYLELKAAESKIATSPVISKPSFDSSQTEFEEISPNRFQIPQAFLDDTLNNFSKVLTQARMVPNLTNDNRTDGFKIFQIRSGSIYEKLGLKDNDIIKRVNGQDLDSFEKATGLFSALRNEKTISIDIVRNGSRLNYTYEIR